MNRRLALALLSVALLASIGIAQSSDDQLADYGDAPDGTSPNYRFADPDVSEAGFPTLLDESERDNLDFVRHRSPKSRVFLGREVTVERNGKTVDEDQDDTFFFDDVDNFDRFSGLSSLPNCRQGDLNVRVNVPQDAPAAEYYLNVLIDWNHDGRWRGAVRCPSAPNVGDDGFVPEWTVQNAALHAEPYDLEPGFDGLVRLTDIPTGPDMGEMWVRVTVTTEPIDTSTFVPARDGGPGWDGRGEFAFGETEDYFGCLFDASVDRERGFDPLSSECPPPAEPDDPAMDPPPDEETPKACPADNRAPVATDRVVEVQSGQQVEFTLGATDPDGDPLRYTLVEGPEFGQLRGTPPNLVYDAPLDFRGNETLEFTVEDDRCGQTRMQVFVTVDNAPPTAVDEQHEIAEDTTLPLTLDGDDPDGDELSCRLVTPPEHGTVVVNDDCSAEYVPDPDFNGEDSFEFEVDDGKGRTDTGVVDITVTPVNDPPVAEDDADTVSNEDTDATIDVLANDRDVDGDDLTIASATGSTEGGTTAINDDGTVTYTPPEDFTGTDTFDYTICDPDNECDTATVTVEVEAVNDPPVANDDAATTDEDTSVTVDIVANDSDVDGNVDPETVQIETSPSNGQTTVNADGTVDYTPDPDFNGTDTFTYTVCDDGSPTPIECSSEATVTITVDPVNDDPEAASIADQTIPEDETLTVDVSCTDVDGDTPSVAATNLPGGASFADNGDGTGTLTYTPGFAVVTHPDTERRFSDVEFTCDDGNGGTDTETFDVTVADVNRAPQPDADSASTDEDTDVTIDVLGNDADPDSEDAIDTTQITSAPSNGSAAINADGTITYTPNADFNGTDTLTYEVCDDVASPNQACNTATVTVDLAPVNDPPVASDDTGSTNEDEPVTVDVRDNDSDVDGDPISITSSTSPSNGSVDCSGGTACDYTPAPDFNGTDSFDYTITDGNGEFDTATATITVNPVNDPPTAGNVDRSMKVNTPNDPQQLNVDLPVSDVDSDDTVAADSLNCALSGSGPANGSVSFGNDCSVTYTPDENFVGDDSFQYEVCDDGSPEPQMCDTATVDVTVSNDAPTADSDSLNTSEDTDVDLTLTGSDPNSDPLDFVIENGPSDGTLSCPGNATDVSSLDCTYTPDENFNGQDSFTFSVTDVQGESDTATVTIDVAPVNDPPVAQPNSHTTDEDVSFSLSLVGTDPDAGDALSYSISNGPSHGTLDCSGASCTYDPDPDVNSTNTPDADAFTFEVCDDGSPQLCDTATHTIDIAAVDDAPVLTPIPDETIPEDQTLTVDLSCTDVEGDAKTLSVDSSALPTSATFTDNGDGTGSIGYTPPFDEVQHPSTQQAFSGITVTCEANGQSDSDDFSITATDVNRAPTADDETTTTDEDTSTTIDVITGDSDPDSEDVANLFVNRVTTAPSNGSTTINGDGTVQYTPTANFDGPSDSFVYEVCDDAPGELCTTATVTVNINAINDPPTADDETVTTDEDIATTVDVLNGDNDIDGNIDPSSVQVTSGPTNGTTTVNADGSIQYDPDLNFNGSDSFVYEVCDDGTPTPAECTTATVDVTVVSVNDAPSLTSIPDQEVFEGNTLSFNVSCSDVDGDALSLSASNLPSGVSFVDNGDGTGTFTYSPGFSIVDHPDSPPTSPVDFTGVTTTCRDTANASDSDDFTITVKDTDRAPTPNSQSLTLLEDGSTSLQLSGSDVDGDSLTFAIASGPSHGTLNCSLPDCTYVPNPDVNKNTIGGDDQFTFEVDDGFGKTKTGTVNLTIEPQEDPPVASDDDGGSVGSDSTETTEDNAVTIDVLANDSDPDGDSLSIIGFTQGSNGSVSCTSADCTYDPDTDFSGTDTFTYTIDDGNGNTASATVTVTVTPTNDGPSAENLSFSEPENHTNPQEITFDLPVSDPDLQWEGDSLTCTVTSGPSNGTLDPSSSTDCSPTYGYTPNAGFVGNDSFTYEVCDSASACASGTVDVTIENIAPEAIRITTETEEDTELPFALSAEDDNNDPLSYEITTAPSDGTLDCPDLSSQPDCTYIPNADFNGDDSFDYRVTDPHGASDTATANIISVNPINDAPTATDDSRSTDEDTSITFDLSVSDVDDATGDLSCTQITPNPSLGSVSIDSATCEATYTPNADANGTDEFAFRVTDPNGLSDTALVSITVNAVDDAPTVQWDDADNAISVDENVTMTATATCTDPDNDAFSLSVTNTPSGASFTDNGDGTGTLTYTPGYDVVAHPDTSTVFSDVQVDCDDGTSTVSDQLEITVNDVNQAPNASDDSYDAAKDTQLSVSAADGVIQNNDTDADGDSLEVSSSDSTSAQGGSVTVNTDGSFTYDPPSGFTGTDSFSYTIADGFGGSDTATVMLDVESQVPDAQDQTLTTPKNTQLAVDITTTDPNGDPISYTITSGVSNGTLDCTNIPNCTYTPNTDFVGTDSFEFEACDDDSPQNCDTATVTINVLNQAPNAVDDSPSTNEDVDVNVDVRANDTEPDGDAILDPTVTSGPSNGSTTVESDGTITYSPDSNYNGSDSFTYEICDDDATNPRCDTATVTITIAAVDDSPTIDAIANQSATEDAEYTLDIVCTDVDSPASDLQLSASGLPQGALFTNLGDGEARISYTPDFDVVTHPDTQRVFSDVTITCSDTNSSSDELFDLTVNDTNRDPTANDTTIDMNEDRQAPIELSGGDLDGDTLTFAIVSGSGPSNGTLTCSGLPDDGSCTYEPDDNFNGTDSFQFEVDDGFGGTDTGTYTFNIAPVNDAPTADAQTTSAIDEDTTSELTITVSGSDIDGDSLTYSLASGVSNGTLDCANIDVDQTCTYLPDENFNGDDSFTFQVDDGNGETDTATVTIPVDPVNDAPTADDVPAGQVSTFQEVEVQVDLPVDDVDLDWEGETLSCSTGSTAPSNGTAAYNDCVLSYTSDDGFVGDETFDYEVCDDGSNGSVLCAEASVTITVNNRQPTAFDISADLDEDGQVNLTLNGSDPDDDPLTCSLASSASNGTATVNSDCTATYEPNPDYNGDDSFQFQVEDGLGGTDTATVSLSITAVNDEPSIQAISNQTIAEDAELTVDVTCTDIDTPSSNLTVSAANLPSGANFTANGDGTGTVTYTPAFTVVSHPDSSETFPDPLIRCDDGSLNDSEGFQITVNDTNRDPSTSTDSYSVNEDDTLSVDAASGVLSNDSDADGDDLSVNPSASDATSAQGGSITINADGSFTYEPSADFNGSDSFSYTVEDGFGGSVTETVDITVDPVNDAPSFTAGADQTVDEDAGAQSVSGWATDISAGPSNESGQSLAFNVSNDNNALFSAQPSIDTSGTLSYTPAPDANGSATVTVSLSDDGGTANGGSDTSAQQTFTITVNPVNDAPTASNDSASTDEDTAVTTANVLDNDTDPDGDTLSVSSFDDSSTTGTVTDNGDGTFTYDPNGQFEDLAEGESATDSFGYTVSDGNGGSDAATVTVTISGVNDAPTSTAISDQTNADGDSINLDVSGNFSDVDGSDTLSYSANGLPSGLSIDSSGVISGTLGSSASQNSPYSVTVTADDGNGGSASESFAWTVSNPAPTASDDSASTDEDTAVTTTNVLDNDTDPDGDTLSVSSFNDSSTTGTVTDNGDGTFTYDPNGQFEDLAEGESATDSFGYTVQDADGATDTATVSITINGANDDPTSTAISDRTNTEGDTVNLDVSGNFSDPDGSDTLSYSASGLPSGLSIDGAMGVISGTIDSNASQNSPYSVTITADDGNGGTVSESFTWTVDSP